MKRYDKLAYKLVNEIQVLNIKEELQEKIKERVDKNQREYILREELKLIVKSLEMKISYRMRMNFSRSVMRWRHRMK